MKSFYFILGAIAATNPCGFPPCYDGEINEQCESGELKKKRSEK